MGSANRVTNLPYIDIEFTDRPRKRIAVDAQFLCRSPQVIGVGDQDFNNVTFLEGANRILVRQVRGAHVPDYFAQRELHRHSSPLWVVRQWQMIERCNQSIVTVILHRVPNLYPESERASSRLPERQERLLNLPRRILSDLYCALFATIPGIYALQSSN
jgi:hypothetical protein